KASDTFKNIAKSVSTDPVVNKQRAEKIAHVDVPEGFAPAQSMEMDIMGFDMKWVIYRRNGNPNAMLMIMESTQPMQGVQGAAGAKQQREQILRSIRQQQAGQQGGMNTEINEESSETREFTINGEKVPFEFIKGNNN